MSHLISFSHLEEADLHPGAIYEAGPKGTIADEPIHPILKVGNMGGIRHRGSTDSPVLVGLFSTLEHSDWPDQIDRSTGVVRYFGDNRTAVSGLLDPKGNRVLREVFRRGFGSLKDRMACPPFFVFTAVDEPGIRKRSQRFEGLAVPGTPSEPEEDWLLAKWFQRPSGRFENYVITLQLLDTGPIPQAWINELAEGDPVGTLCPSAYRRWVEFGHQRS